MIGKAFVWKVVTDSALTAELGRSFQWGITSGKNENLYALVRAFLMWKFADDTTVSEVIPEFKNSSLQDTHSRPYQYLGPISRKSRKLFGPEKPFVKLAATCF